MAFHGEGHEARGIMRYYYRIKDQNFLKEIVNDHDVVPLYTYIQSGQSEHYVVYVITYVPFKLKLGYLLFIYLLLLGDKTPNICWLLVPAA